MCEQKFTFINIAPPVQTFIDFRTKCGWGTISFDAADKALRAGIANMTVFKAETVVGFGRVIGDGAIYFYVQDLIIDHRYRGAGLGAVVMKHLIEQVRKVALPGATIGLMSALDKEDFYKRFGFVSRPNSKYGAGMTLLLDV